MFYRLCERYRPSMAVELGAWQGTCAAHMAGGGAATVVTIDHHSDRRGETHPPGDDVNEALCREVAQRYGVFYLKGWTWDDDVLADVRALDKPIDVLFIDGWHHYDKAMRDWNLYRPMLSIPALVVCDDLENVEPTLHRMEEFWDDVSWNRERFVTPRVAAYPMGFFKYEG
jgi:predicted O-methyltransferase YrrM